MTPKTYAISIRQPWAWAILNGKDVENRVARGVTKTGAPRRPTSYTGLIGIHASQAVSRDGMRDPRILALAERLGVDLGQLPTGVIIGVAVVGETHLDDGACCGPWGDREVFRLPLTQPRTISAPVPARGGLGLPWAAREDAAHGVWEQLEEL